ncbi:glycosyltransferase family 4 protein [Pontibacillus salicampi]|uniref:Glycosyltransferase family 4 protein n=1 Tax=Pontibacillus salicampi TaxID=1449801 RepID=A0ABV6LSN1_9BACI
MRITFGVLTLCKGGAQRMLAELANGLVARGHDVEIVIPSFAEVAYDVTAKLKRIPKATISAEDYRMGDVIISNWYTLVPEAEKASQQGKGRHLRISLCYEPALMDGTSETFLSYQQTSNVIVLSTWQQQLMKLIHGLDCPIVPVGVSRAFHNDHVRTPHPLKIGAVVRRLGDENWHRQQDYLISVLRTIKREHPSVDIHLITPPVEFQSSERLQLLQRTTPFHFHTPSNDMELNALYNQLHIFVNTSIYDSASLPGLEAMKCGAALVTTYNGGNSDYTNNGVNCLVSYPYEYYVKEHISQLIHNPALREQLAAQGQATASQWSWERSIQKLEQVLHG